MKTLEFGNEVTQNCVKTKACGTKVKFDSSSFIKKAFLNSQSRIEPCKMIILWHSF